MNQGFIRRLTKPLSDELALSACDILRQNGIEIFTRDDEEADFGVVLGNVLKGDCCIYVSAADYEQAKKLLCGSQLEDYISKECLVAQEKNQAELAEQEYLRKKKINLMECVVVLVLAILFYLYRAM